MEQLVSAAPNWQLSCSGATVGLLALRGLSNPSSHPALAAEADRLERELRARFGDLSQDALRATPPLPAYAAWYKRFGQRYHVMLQLESVVRNGKPIPRVAALVEAMFIAELRSLLLTAGHDLDSVALPVLVAVGTGQERLTTPGGKETAVKPGDIFTRDSGGVLSAIVSGPADRARIVPTTTAALFVAYASPGVSPADVEHHLDEIERLARLLGPRPERIGRVTLTA